MHVLISLNIITIINVTIIITHIIVILTHIINIIHSSSMAEEVGHYIVVTIQGSHV